MSKTRFALLLSAALLAVQASEAAESPLKIGVMLCLSGDCSAWGASGLKGARLAAEQLNSAGGVNGRRIELVVEDSRDTQPATSVSAFKKLTSDPEMHFIVGPTWTVGAMPIAPLAGKNKRIVIISPSVGVKEFNEAAANIFNDWPHDEVATRAIAAYAAKQGWSKGAVFGSQDPFYMTQSDIFEEEFKKRGGRILLRIDPLPDAVDLRSEALRIKTAAPDFVVMTNYQADFIAKSLKQVALTAPLLAVQMEKERVKAADGALEGVVFAMYEEPRVEFQRDFKQRFAEEPGISADTAYDAVMLLADAIKRAGSFDPERVREMLAATHAFKGASGTFSFDAKGAVDKRPVLRRVRGLDYELVQ